MPSIDEILAKRDAAAAERPQFDDSDFKLRDDKTPGSVAMAVAYSLYSGQADDPYMEYWQGHGYPAIGNKGGQYTRIVYCPVLSGHDENYKCEGCANDVKAKDRFGLWLYVEKILYSSLVGDEKYLPEQWLDGNRYFTQPVNRVQYWDSSAWKDSPLGDIQMLAKQLGDLRKTRVTIKSTGTGLDKRYKFYPEMGSPPIPAELYERCVKEIRPVLDVLRESIARVETVSQPDTVAFDAPSNVTPIAVPAPSANEPPKLPPFKAPSKPEKLF